MKKIILAVLMFAPLLPQKKITNSYTATLISSSFFIIDRINTYK